MNSEESETEEIENKKVDENSESKVETEETAKKKRGRPKKTETNS